MADVMTECLLNGDDCLVRIKLYIYQLRSKSCFVFPHYFNNVIRYTTYMSFPEIGPWEEWHNDLLHSPV